MKVIKSKKGIALLATLAVAVVAAIGAYAYFTSTGHGTGSATVGTSSDWTVTTDTATGGPMTPGGGLATYETVGYTIANPSSGHQNLANVNIKIADANGDPWSSQADNTKPACSATDFQLSLDGTTWEPVGGSLDDARLAQDFGPGDSHSQSIEIRMFDANANQDNCKNATVPLYLFAS
jgi:hypothetical protein